MIKDKLWCMMVVTSKSRLWRVGRLGSLILSI